MAFRYVKHDVHKRPVAQKDGRLYRETPVRLIYSEGCYYLIAYNEKHESFPAYRVDRMQGLRLTDTPAVRNTAIATFDADAYSAACASRPPAIWPRNTPPTFATSWKITPRAVPPRAFRTRKPPLAPTTLTILAMFAQGRWRNRRPLMGGVARPTRPPHFRNRASCAVNSAK